MQFRQRVLLKHRGLIPEISTREIYVRNRPASFFLPGGFRYTTYRATYIFSSPRLNAYIAANATNTSRVTTAFSAP